MLLNDGDVITLKYGWRASTCFISTYLLAPRKCGLCSENWVYLSHLTPSLMKDEQQTDWYLGINPQEGTRTRAQRGRAHKQRHHSVH